MQDPVSCSDPRATFVRSAQRCWRTFRMGRFCLDSLEQSELRAMDFDTLVNDTAEMDRLHDPVGFRTRELWTCERRPDGRTVDEPRPTRGCGWLLGSRERGSCPVVQVSHGNSKVLVSARPATTWRVTVQVPGLCYGRSCTHKAMELTEYLEKLVYPIIEQCYASEPRGYNVDVWCWELELSVLDEDGSLHDVFLESIQQILPRCIEARQEHHDAREGPDSTGVHTDERICSMIARLHSRTFLVVHPNAPQDLDSPGVRLVVDPSALEEHTASTLVTAIFYTHEPKSQPVLYFLECRGRPLTADQLTAAIRQVSESLVPSQR